MAEQQQQHPRRWFLSRVCELLGAGVAVLVSVPILGLFIAPLFKPREDRWVRLGALSEVRPDVPTRFVYSYLSEDAYLQTVVRGTLYAVQGEQNELRVLSNVCPHAGCGVRWENGTETFFCPCHNARFDAQGKVVAGPPPRPLDEVEHRIEDGLIYVKLRA